MMPLLPGCLAVPVLVVSPSAAAAYSFDGAMRDDFEDLLQLDSGTNLFGGGLTCSLIVETKIRYPYSLCLSRYQTLAILPTAPVTQIDQESTAKGYLKGSGKLK